MNTPDKTPNIQKSVQSSLASIVLSRSSWLLRSHTRGILFTLTTIFAFSLAAAAQSRWRKHEFNSANLDSGWTVRCSGGSEATVENGWARIQSRGNGFAHIQRPLGEDFVTLTATMKSLATAYVVWDADNWCGVGVTSPTPFGRFYSVLTTAGETVETDHRGCFRGAPYDFQIQIGKDCIRLSYKNGGFKEWILLSACERPKDFSGAPVLIAFGKNYGPDSHPFADPNTTQPGGLSVADDTMFIRDILIEDSPKESLRLTPQERKRLGSYVSDPVGSIVLRRNEDPTFEAIRDYYPAMKWPREVVGVPEHPKDIGINPRGRIDDASRNWQPIVARFEVGNPPVPFGGEDAPIKRRLLEGYLPVDTLTTIHGDVQYELTIFGWSEDLRVDKDLYTYCRMTARPLNGTTQPDRLTLLYGKEKTSTWEMSAAGNHAQVWMRFKHPEPETAELVTAEEFGARQDEVVAGWKARLKPAKLFEIPDPRVNEAYRAWLVYSLLNSDTINGRNEIHDGAGFYEEMFGHSVGLHSLAMDMYAMPDYVERIIDGMLHWQKENGLYYMNCGLQDHGVLLHAIATHYQMTKNKTWFRRVAPQAVKACEWLVQQRAEAPKEGVTKGIIKFRPYNDAPNPAYNYLGNCQAAVGLKAIAEALAAEGFTVEAAKCRAEAVRYRQDILNSMEAAAFEYQGLTILPLEPDTRRIEKMSKYRGGDYYGLTVGSLLQTGFLEPFDKRSCWMTELMEKRKGLVAGQCEFMEGIDHAYTYGYWMTQLQRNEIRKVLLGFWGMFAFGMTRDTYSPVEVSHVQTGENHTTLPHTYSLTEQLRLLRNMLVWEDGNALRLGQAIPCEWLEPGKRVAINGAPTLFGPMSYSITANQDGTMRAKVAPPTRKVPELITLRLRHPQNRSIAAVTGSGSRRVKFTGDMITLLEGTSSTDLLVSFK